MEIYQSPTGYILSYCFREKLHRVGENVSVKFRNQKSGYEGRLVMDTDDGNMYDELVLEEDGNYNKQAHCNSEHSASIVFCIIFLRILLAFLKIVRWWSFVDHPQNIKVSFINGKRLQLQWYLTFHPYQNREFNSFFNLSVCIANCIFIYFVGAVCRCFTYELFSFGTNVEYIASFQQPSETEEDLKRWPPHPRDYLAFNNFMNFFRKLRGSSSMI